STRRRHTRFSRDWSSDVCSSDLPHRVLGRGHALATFVPRTGGIGGSRFSILGDFSHGSGHFMDGGCGHLRLFRLQGGTLRRTFDGGYHATDGLLKLLFSSSDMFDDAGKVFQKLIEAAGELTDLVIGCNLQALS